MAGDREEDFTEEDGRKLLEEFLHSISEDPYSRQALADALAEGMFPVSDDGTISFNVNGLNWMEQREDELRAQGSN